MSLLFTHAPILWHVVFFSFLGGYLSGSIPFGLLLGKVAGLGDIRTKGSGNIGATNVLRLGGKGLGAVTLFLDAVKGVLPVLAAAQVSDDAAVAAALGAFVGHLFPVWLRFRGGKGVAVALGVLLALSFKVGAMLCLIWLAVAMMARTSSISSLTTFVAAPVIAALLTADSQLVTVALVIALMVWIKHAPNIRRIAAGTEGKMSFKKPDAA